MRNRRDQEEWGIRYTDGAASTVEPGSFRNLPSTRPHRQVLTGSAGYCQPFLNKELWINWHKNSGILKCHIQILPQGRAIVNLLTIMPQAKTDREYHSYLRTFCGDFMEVSPSANRSQLETAPTNVVETENAYRIQVALPGFRKDQIQLRV